MTDRTETLPIVIVGEVLVDRFEDGTEIIGGAPMNVAWNLAGLGQDPLFISAVGTDDAGQRILESMRSWGMRIDGVKQRADVPTGSVAVTLDQGEPSYDIVQNVAYDQIDSEHAAGAIGDYRRMIGAPTHSGGILYHGSLCYRGETSRQTIDAIKRDWVGDVFLDINIRDRNFDSTWIETLMRGVTILKCNWDEILRMQNGPSNARSAPDTIDSADEVIEIAKRIVDQYRLKTLWLTAGSDGAYGITGEGLVESVTTPTVHPSEFRDAVGAGDAFAAAAISGQVRRDDPATILDHAVRHAASVCTLRGATTEDRSFYRA